MSDNCDYQPDPCPIDAKKAYILRVAQQGCTIPCACQLFTSPPTEDCQRILALDLGIIFEAVGDPPEQAWAVMNPQPDKPFVYYDTENRQFYCVCEECRGATIVSATECDIAIVCFSNVDPPQNEPTVYHYVVPEEPDAPYWEPGLNCEELQCQSDICKQPPQVSKSKALERQIVNAVKKKTDKLTPLAKKPSKVKFTQTSNGKSKVSTKSNSKKPIDTVTSTGNKNEKQEELKLADATPEKEEEFKPAEPAPEKDDEFKPAEPAPEKKTNETPQ
jgi:hypothetical protein